MKIVDYLRIAVASLRRRKARTILTALGIFIGTLCIILMLAIGLSGYSQLQQSIQDTPTLTQITVEAPSDTSAQNAQLNDATIAGIAQMPHVKAISPIVTLPVVLRVQNYEAVVSVSGLSASALKVKMACGAMFNDNETVPTLVLGGDSLASFLDAQTKAPFRPNANDSVPGESLLNSDAELSLGYINDGAGDASQPQTYRVRIVGITKQNTDYSSTIYLDLGSAKQLMRENSALAQKLEFPPYGTYQQALVIVDNVNNVAAVQKGITDLGFETNNALEWISQTRAQQSRQQFQLFAIGLVALVVAAIGIANTMYASVLEQQKDIGIMKALGMRSRQVQTLFLAEAVFIGFIGSLLAIVAALVISIAINTGGASTSLLSTYFGNDMHITIPLWLCLLAILLATVTCALSGLHPSRQAAKMTTVEALSGTRHRKQSDHSIFPVELKRALTSREFRLAALGFALALCGAVISVLLPIFQGHFTGRFDISFVINLMYSALSSNATLFLLPLFAAIPFTTSFLDDYKSTFYRSYLSRVSSKNYRQAKMFSTFLSGGLVLVAGIGAASILFCLLPLFLGIVFPQYVPVHLLFAPEVQSDFIVLIQKIFLIFLSGCFWAMTGAIIATWTKNRYVAYAAPFIIYYLLTILYTRYIPAIKIINPQFWTEYAPAWTGGAGGLILWLGELLTLSSVMYLWLMGRILKNE